MLFREKFITSFLDLISKQVTIKWLCSWLCNNWSCVYNKYFYCFEFKARKYFNSKTSMKSKYKCGDVLGFKINEALRFIGQPEREQTLRRFVTSTKRGWAGRLTFPGTGQVSGRIHTQRMQLRIHAEEEGQRCTCYTYNAHSIIRKCNVNINMIFISNLEVILNLLR